ncbi:MAG: metalloregulator ArsR/SmtB family transcription factor [Actinomycetota bacterium]|nr:metalloregulator ArsR/SmtB family transcription factor [Actinomycetota bacterium]
MPVHSSDPPLPNELVELVARRFAALGDPMRVRLLDVLRRRGEASVGELAAELDSGYANVAKHLSLLHQQHILGRAKQGTRVVYRISDPVVLELCELVCGTVSAQLRELEALVSAAVHPASKATKGGT